METHTTIRSLAAVALALPALALAACGSDEAPAADREQQARDAQLAYARCMREHGVDMPDPQPAGEGGVMKIAPAGGASPEKLRRAEQACRKHLEDIEPPELTEEQKREFEEAALAHARCMRDHGVDMPDPTFGEDGRAQIRIGKGGPDPDDPDVREAEEACRGKLPKPPSSEGSP